MPPSYKSKQRKYGFHASMARTKSVPAPASPQTASTPAPARAPAALSTPAPAPDASPADRPATDTSAPPKVLHQPKKPAHAAKKSLKFQDFINDANSSGDDADANPRARKLQRQRMLEQMPVMNLGSRAFSPIGKERPKTPPTPGGADDKDADAMEVDGKAPADLDGKAPADLDGKAPSYLAGVPPPPTDIFESDDEDDMCQEPATWAGDCLFPKTCTKENHMDNDPKGNDPVDNSPCTEEPADQDKQPCRLMPRNYNKKPPMHSGSVYNATQLVRMNSTYIARNQSSGAFPGAFSTPDESVPEIENPISKETTTKAVGLVWGGGSGGSPTPFVAPNFLKRSGLSEDEDVDTK